MIEDPEARFARRLGLAVGRLDWWKIPDEHTPYEWALQQLADHVDPIGEPRADMRAARNTVRLMTAINPSISEATLNQEADSLRNYLECNQPPEETVLLPEEAAALRQ